jgi:acetyltransferase-like isoleucine patch superfamily enzyme
MADTKASFFAHSHALVETTDVGEGTTIWAFVHVLPGARIGAHCNICDHCFIESGVVIGDNVTLKCGIYLWKGVTIEDNVFLGPNVVFTNDLRPRSKNANFSLAPTLIKHGASLGANSTILAGVTIGRYALTGIGSVITRDVKDYALVYGNPARQHGWVDELGEKMHFNAESGYWHSIQDNKYIESETGLTPVL